MRKFLCFAFLLFSIYQSQSQVFLNEIICTPEAPRNDGGASAGEWVELYAIGAVDISCHVLTDGDWTVTIPDGTTMSADSYYVIGRGSFANTPGGNGQLAAVGADDPANAGTINATADASTGCSTSISIDIAGSAAGYTDIGVGVGSPNGWARASNGTGGWQEEWTIDATPGADNRGSGLPVEFISFSVKPVDNDIKIDWATGSELNNDYFVIEYSSNGNFEELGRVLGAGTTSEMQEYSFMHENMDNGTHYYRLKQVDFDGKFEYTDLKSVKLIYGDDVLVYPTVVEKSFTIQNNEEFEEGAQYEVFDLSGRAIQTGALVDIITEIDAESWNQGHYVIHIRQNGNRTIKRIIK